MTSSHFCSLSHQSFYFRLFNFVYLSFFHFPSPLGLVSHFSFFLFLLLLFHLPASWLPSASLLLCLPVVVVCKSLSLRIAELPASVCSCELDWHVFAKVKQNTNPQNHTRNARASLGPWALVWTRLVHVFESRPYPSPFYPHFPRCGRDHKPNDLFTLVMW